MRDTFFCYFRIKYYNFKTCRINSITTEQYFTGISGNLVESPPRSITSTGIYIIVVWSYITLY